MTKILFIQTLRNTTIMTHLTKLLCLIDMLSFPLSLFGFLYFGFNDYVVLSVLCLIVVLIRMFQVPESGMSKGL